ncbi:GNAT family N-acetyltransferase [Dasania marina]|uniref:GNAT family N-acetyltransferase n=1 Tax=Dasania marina TaxID=471499 RepID=UPI000A0100C5
MPAKPRRYLFSYRRYPSLSVYLDEEDADAQHIYPEYKRYGYVADLVVARTHRRQGLAQQLMRQAEQHCKTLGLTTIKVSSLACNTSASDFYQAIGYQPTERVFTKALTQ